MAKTGDNIQGKPLATVVGHHYILEGMFSVGSIVVSVRRRHSHNSTVFFTSFSTIFCVRFSLFYFFHQFFRFSISIDLIMHVRFFFPLFSKDADISHASAIQSAISLVVISAIGIVANNQMTLIAYHIAMKIRVAVSSVIYKKVLRMSQTAMGDASPGKIVNLLSNDVNRFDSLTKFGCSLWCSPLLMFVIGYLLWLEVQWAGLIGMAIVFIIVPIQSKYAWLDLLLFSFQ